MVGWMFFFLFVPLHKLNLDVVVLFVQVTETNLNKLKINKMLFLWLKLHQFSVTCFCSNVHYWCPQLSVIV